MSLAKKESDLTNEKTSVNPAANTKKKSTQVQSPNTMDVSADGNSAGHGVANIRNNPQGNKPMSVNTGKVGKGGDTKH